MKIFEDFFDDIDQDNIKTPDDISDELNKAGIKYYLQIGVEIYNEQLSTINSKIVYKIINYITYIISNLSTYNGPERPDMTISDIRNAVHIRIDFPVELNFKTNEFMKVLFALMKLKEENKYLVLYLRVVLQD